MKLELVLTVEVQVDKGVFVDKDTIAKDLHGHVVQVKSGVYENAIEGHIVAIAIQPPFTKAKR